MTGGLAGGWKADYLPWRERFEPFFSGLESTEVFVLSWGPGKYSSGFSKRESIVADLATRAGNHVATPEQIIEQDTRFKGYTTLEAEEIQAAEADVIICLIVDNPKAGGAPTELSIFERNPAVQPKIRCLLPIKELKGLLYEAAHQIPGERSFRYTPTQFQRCDDIRAKCHQWVEAVRRHKHLSRWKETKSTN